MILNLDNSQLTTIGISFVVSTFVVTINNLFLYYHSCPKADKPSDPLMGN